jgi:hypothetical protein
VNERSLVKGGVACGEPAETTKRGQSLRPAPSFVMERAAGLESVTSTLAKQQVV